MKKGKFTQFPTITLEEALDLIDKVVRKRGEVGSTMREISLSTGIPEGTLPLPLSTCCQYGIYENNYGGGYRTTTLYTRIKLPTYPEDKAKAIFEALNNPILYKDIINEFNNKILPDPNTGFANHLITKYGIKAYAIPKIVAAFYQNFKNYIDTNNKLRLIYIATGETEVINTPAIVHQNNPPAIINPPILNTEEQFREDLQFPDGFVVHIYGKGINTRLSLSDDDDFLILEATLNKLKKKVKSGEKEGT